MRDGARETALGPLAARDFRLDRRDSVGSTNAEAFAADGDRLWIVADEQTAGRGRQARAWASPRGNLYASLRLIDPAPAARAAELSFVAGVALTDAILGLAPVIGPRLALKWPNDVLIGGAKAAGILVEGSHGAGGFVAVIGCGVNIVSHPDGTPYPATHLAAHQPAVTRGALFSALSDAFAARLGQWARGEGFAAIRAAWLDRAAGLGRPIVVRLNDRTLTGVFSGLDDDGALRLEAEGGACVRIGAGEIMTLPLSGQA